MTLGENGPQASSGYEQLQVQALERTEVLEIPANQLGSMVRQYESLLRVIALALKDRGGIEQ